MSGGFALLCSFFVEIGMGFTAELKTYPSGAEYYEMRIGKDLIGYAQIVDGGFLAPNRRKPVATLKEAAKQALNTNMNVCMAEHDRLRKMLGRVLRT